MVSSFVLSAALFKVAFTAGNHLPWNIPFETQAKAFYDILEAIFDYVDSNLEPKGLGLMTKEKEVTMLEITDMAGGLRIHLSL